MAGISALVAALTALHKADFEVCPLADHHRSIPKPEGAKA